MPNSVSVVNHWTTLCSNSPFRHRTRWARMRRKRNSHRIVIKETNSGPNADHGMTDEKFVTIGNMTTADSPTAVTGHTCAKGTTEIIPISDVSHATKVTPMLDLEYLGHELSTHPDNPFVSTIMNQARYGARLGYTGPRHYRELETGLLRTCY